MVAGTQQSGQPNWLLRLGPPQGDKQQACYLSSSGESRRQEEVAEVCKQASMLYVICGIWCALCRWHWTAALRWPCRQPSVCRVPTRLAAHPAVCCCTGELTATQALRNACDDLKDVCVHIKATFKKELENQMQE